MCRVFECCLINTYYLSVWLRLECLLCLVITKGLLVFFITEQRVPNVFSTSDSSDVIAWRVIALVTGLTENQYRSYIYIYCWRIKRSNHAISRVKMVAEKRDSLYFISHIKPRANVDEEIHTVFTSSMARHSRSDVFE